MREQIRAQPCLGLRFGGNSSCGLGEEGSFAKRASLLVLKTPGTNRHGQSLLVELAAALNALGIEGSGVQPSAELLCRKEALRELRASVLRWSA